MTESIQTALLLFAVGMITVFVILGGVVMSGHFLIRIVNGLVKTPILAHESSQIENLSISHKQIAVISAAVDQLTEGKGVIEKIEKI